jgi:hypothetical protein
MLDVLGKMYGKGDSADAQKLESPQPHALGRRPRFYLAFLKNRVSLAMLDFQIQKTPLTIRHERAQSERTNLTTELQRGCTASAERMPSRDRAAVIKTI